MALGGGRIGSLCRAAARLDQELSARRHSPLLDRALPHLTRAADRGVVWMAVAGRLALVGGPRGRRAARTGMAAVAITSALANQLGKRSFGRRRPLLDAVPLGRRAYRVPISASFPSGHAASAAAFATTVPAAAVPVGVLAIGVAGPEAGMCCQLSRIAEFGSGADSVMGLRSVMETGDHVRGALR